MMLSVLSSRAFNYGPILIGTVASNITIERIVIFHWQSEHYLKEHSCWTAKLPKHEDLNDRINVEYITFKPSLQLWSNRNSDKLTSNITIEMIIFIVKRLAEWTLLGTLVFVVIHEVWFLLSQSWVGMMPSEENHSSFVVAPGAVL